MLFPPNICSWIFLVYFLSIMSWHSLHYKPIPIPFYQIQDNVIATELISLPPSSAHIIYSEHQKVILKYYVCHVIVFE